MGSTIGTLLGTSIAEVRLPIAPQDIGFINSERGQSVLLTDESRADGSVWTGTLARIEARIDDQTRVYPAIVEVPTPLEPKSGDYPLRFGMFVRAEILGSEVAEAVLIPTAALHGDNDVFLFEDGQLVRHPVTVARINRQGALVTSGLVNGDRVVVTRLDLMFDGLAVAIANE
ncbi:efflux transporter, RND family, MFP subunit subfamily [Luminiphilus syltensis NOR5-1B]|uniref:Efflux transporter, RND family, MFP subunit subfamily n=1 Tax=Luminiphilus syltensis NOR5-1B TaxID=565045 RepID=B8KW81_9GAMM|nr:HlyD family efflux transporter periplasmic adaptor subunit [Luminiphilus syltensis]EED35151.1 efflux transporter, RND family, MFP subunit subfamily [Luminiphilus syltensis NOR5-1B]